MTTLEISAPNCIFCSQLCRIRNYLERNTKATTSTVDKRRRVQEAPVPKMKAIVPVPVANNIGGVYKKSDVIGLCLGAWRVSWKIRIRCYNILFQDTEERQGIYKGPLLYMRSAHFSGAYRIFQQNDPNCTYLQRNVIKRDRIWKRVRPN